MLAARRLPRRVRTMATGPSAGRWGTTRSLRGRARRSTFFSPPTPPPRPLRGSQTADIRARSTPSSRVRSRTRSASTWDARTTTCPRQGPSREPSCTGTGARSVSKRFTKKASWYWAMRDPGTTLVGSPRRALRRRCTWDRINSMISSCSSISCLRDFARRRAGRARASASPAGASASTAVSANWQRPRWRSRSTHPGCGHASVRARLRSRYSASVSSAGAASSSLSEEESLFSSCRK
mmetsp:Transcript_14538/g.49208  ORF Transcript_14538/g.49208 Transcript_14538/m.49208 type:complete len:238 (+) Transcript_14538:251-964(+)